MTERLTFNDVAFIFNVRVFYVVTPGLDGSQCLEGETLSVFSESRPDKITYTSTLVNGT